VGNPCWQLGRTDQGEGKSRREAAVIPAESPCKTARFVDLAGKGSAAIVLPTQCPHKAFC
jgi:hypothetical protein